MCSKRQFRKNEISVNFLPDFSVSYTIVDIFISVGPAPQLQQTMAAEHNFITYKQSSENICETGVNQDIWIAVSPRWELLLGCWAPMCQIFLHEIEVGRPSLYKSIH